MCTCHQIGGGWCDVHGRRGAELPTDLERAARAAETVRRKLERAHDDRARDTEAGSRAWRQTYTGRQVFPLDPRPGDFAIEDIAHGLAHICRYGGATRRHYSVAEHSVLVSLFGDPSFARHKLMHDAAEAVLGFDAGAPLKRHPAFAFLKAVEEPIEIAIWTQFDCLAPGDCKEIDDRIVADERAALMAPPAGRWRTREPLGAVISGFRPEVAKDLFLRRFEELFPEYTGP